MAHFAKIGLNNKVINVVTVNNNELLDADGVEQEVLGCQFLEGITGWAVWKQTSYNANFRKHFAGVGYTYDEGRDAFIAPKPFASWILNEETCNWEAPVAKPNDENKYKWSEENQQWEVVDNS